MKNYNDAQEIKKYDTDNEYRINSNKGFSQYNISGIKDILIERGLFWTTKHAKNMDYVKMVEGLAGAESSYQIVYQLAKWVKASKEPLKETEELMNIKTLNDLCTHKV